VKGHDVFVITIDRTYTILVGKDSWMVLAYVKLRPFCFCCE
jgi:hypothetical protein